MFFSKINSGRIENIDGFSLIELVVVVSVLSLLSAIAIPSFTCMVRKARAVSALTSIKQIKRECVIGSYEDNNQFNLPNISSYTIDGDGNNCKPSSQEILFNPNTEELPSFKLNTSSQIISYVYKGISGTNLTRCLNFICDTTFQESGISNVALKNNLETNQFVVKDTYVERQCSAYVLVNGPTWQEAQQNATAIGGNLASLNSSEENSWFAKEFAKDKYSYDGDTNPGDPENWINLWIGGKYSQSSGEWEWDSGEDFDVNDYIGDDDPGIGTGKGTDSVNLSSDKYMLAHFNHRKDENQSTRHGNGEGTFYFDATSGSSNNTRGIVEIKTC